MSLIVKDTGKYGRGIFTTSDIKKDELVEVSPVIIIPKEEWDCVGKTIFYHYCYIWDGTEDTVLALGYGSLFNHSYEPNLNSICNHGNISLDFYALRDIKAGEELTINYHGDLDNRSPLWFDVIE